MELLTGKNKEQFEKWLITSKEFKVILEIIEHAGIKFDYLPFKMQIGVLLAYYDGLDIPISVEWFDQESEEEAFYIKVGVKTHYTGEPFKNRNIALKAAFIKANEITNKLT